MVFNLLSSRQDDFFEFPLQHWGLLWLWCHCSTLQYLFTLSFSHTFLPSEPGLGLPAEDVKSSQGAKATVSSQWLE